MKTTAAIKGAVILGVFQIVFFPNISLIIWAFIAMGIDFFSGLIKSKFINEKATSGRLKDTVGKYVQYVGAMVLGIILNNTIKQDNQILEYVNDGLIIFIIYVEVFSIIENLIAIAPDSPITNIVFKPLLNILSLRINLKRKNDSNA